MRPMPGPLDRSVCSDSTLCPCEPAPPGEDRRAWSGDRSPGLTVALSGFSALRTPITQRSGGCGLVLAAQMTAAADGISQSLVRIVAMAAFAPVITLPLFRFMVTDTAAV